MKKAGGKFIVFGSGRARQIPDGRAKEKADAQFVALLKRMGPLAETHVITVTVKQLQSAECSYINRIGVAAKLIRAAGHPKIRLLADLHHMADVDLNLVTNDEVLAVNQGYRVANQINDWEVWAKDLADGGKAVALSNLSDKDQVIGFTKSQIGLAGIVRDLWHQKNIGPMGENFSTMVSTHGVALVKITP